MVRLDVPASDTLVLTNVRRRFQQSCVQLRPLGHREPKFPKQEWREVVASRETLAGRTHSAISPEASYVKGEPDGVRLVDQRFRASD